MIEIDIATDFTDAPGPRYIKQGEYSGELFREEWIVPKFEEAIGMNTQLLINLDGTFGYPTSFLDEAFGGLKHKYNSKLILDTLSFVSHDEIGLIDEIKGYIIQND